VRAAYKESSTGVVHPRLSVHRSFTRLNEVGNSFLEAAESFSSSEDISNISVHDYNKEFVEAFDAQSEHDDHIDDAKLKSPAFYWAVHWIDCPSVLGCAENSAWCTSLERVASKAAAFFTP